ncbi:hypothetical protein GCM10017776_25280 [Streptomyces griseoluteus]|nr:hypothetical protein GCM10017776_25280 [Streptomyces griseoluteus]
MIWLARIFTSSWVAAGRVESETTCPAALMCLMIFAVAGMAKGLRRAVMGALLWVGAGGFTVTTGAVAGV